jgi:site-specific DNA recombinase
MSVPALIVNLPVMLQRIAGDATFGPPGSAFLFRTGHLYTILCHPLYVEQVRHKGQAYQGDHPGIVDPGIWDQVQAQLASNAAARRRGASTTEPSLLVGLLFDRGSTRVTPTHAGKNGKRYRSI